MRRFRRGATNGPSLVRPGAGYGRICFGAPGPTQEVEPREALIPELFTDDQCISASSFDSHIDEEGDTIIDLTSD